MDTVIVASSQFYSHYPKRIPRGTVNAEAVLIRLDSEWDGLTVRIHWLNVASKVEKNPLLERDKPNTIPWEVLTDLGELRMGLVGLNGKTVIKPTIWLTYGYVTEGVDPESGSDPQPPTPSWEQQMVEQATQANQAAQAAQQAAEEAAKAVASAGPYAEQAKQSAEAAKASQDAAATSARQANEAAQTAQNAAGSIGDAVKRAEDAATAAGTAQQAAANSAKEAEDAKLEAQKAAAILPAPTQEDAGKFPMVNPEGNGYIFGEAGGGGVGGELLQTISGENYGNVAYNFPEGKNTFFVVGTLNVNADKGTVVVYQDVKTYDKKFAYLPFWDFYGQAGKTLRVHLVFERARIGEDGTSLLRLSGVVSGSDTDGPGRRSTYLQSPWTDLDSNGLKLGLFTGFIIAGTFDSVNLRVYGA